MAKEELLAKLSRGREKVKEMLNNVVVVVVVVAICQFNPTFQAETRLR